MIPENLSGKASKSVAKKIKVKYAKNVSVEKESRLAALAHGMSQVVQTLADAPSPSVFLPDDFKSYAKIALGGRHVTIPHFPTGYKLKVYQPLVFRALRAKFGVAEEHFEDCFLREYKLSKSFPNVYYSTDKDFIFKFLEFQDISHFLNMIRPYYEHIVLNKNATFLPKYLSLCRIYIEGKYTYVVIMKNSTRFQGLETVCKQIISFSSKNSESEAPTSSGSLDFDLDEKTKKVVLKRLGRDLDFLSQHSIRKLTIYAKISEKGPPPENHSSDSVSDDVWFNDEPPADLPMKDPQSRKLLFTITDFSSNLSNTKLHVNKLHSSMIEASEETVKPNKQGLNVEKCLRQVSSKMFLRKIQSQLV